MPRREVRLSLRTKDRQVATRILASRVFAVTNLFKDLQPWEVDAEERQALFERGMELIKSYGKQDLDDEFDLGFIGSELGTDDLRAYVFALEHLQERKRRKKHSKDGGVRAAAVSIASHSEVPNSGSHQPFSQNLQQQQNDEKIVSAQSPGDRVQD